MTTPSCWTDEDQYDPSSNSFKEAVTGTKSPRSRYETDASYRHLVDVMESMINECRFTPSEMREAAVLASIHYELKSAVVGRYAMDPELKLAVEAMTAFRNRYKP